MNSLKRVINDHIFVLFVRGSSVPSENTFVQYAAWVLDLPGLRRGAACLRLIEVPIADTMLCVASFLDRGQAAIGINVAASRTVT